MASNTSTSDVAEASVGGGELGADGETSIGPDGNVLAALSYLFGIVSGLLVYLLEEDNEFARFHAAQSVVLSGGVIVLYMVAFTVNMILTFALSDIFLIGWIVTIVSSLVMLAVWLGVFLVWLYAIVTAFQGKQTRLPIIAGLAEQHLL